MSGSPTPEAAARLVLASDRRRVAPLDASQPLTIGRAASNRLCLTSAAGVSDHHAVVRYSAGNGWVVCDWQSTDGTYLEGERIRRCRPLSDGDEIQLGRQGPVLVFSLQAVAAAAASPAAAPAAASPAPPATPPPAAPSARPQPQAQAPRNIDINGTAVPIGQIRSAVVRSEPHYPHIFSWWLLTSVIGLLLLPVPLLFWPLELAALAAWIVLGSRKSHTLVVVLHDGQAQRRPFANRVTALSHRNGIRAAIGQSLETP